MELTVCPEEKKLPREGPEIRIIGIAQRCMACGREGSAVARDQPLRQRAVKCHL